MSEVMNVGTRVMGIGSERAALGIALEQCIGYLERQARDAGHELAYGSIEISTETRQIESRTLTQATSKIEFNRVMHATGIAVKATQDSPVVIEGDESMNVTGDMTVVGDGRSNVSGGGVQW